MSGERERTRQDEPAAEPADDADEQDEAYSEDEEAAVAARLEDLRYI
ncbi:MAG TPA: hypothetical protein VHS27_09780 [Gaiellales bacterium]|jgi:hypothetical protein|nr:hypothetical protein [Gaiellales bacterium]